MKHLVDLIKESAVTSAIDTTQPVNERRLKKSRWDCDALGLMTVLDGEDGEDSYRLMDEYGISDADGTWLADHSFIIRSSGGYDGDGSSCVDILQRSARNGGFNINWLKKKLKGFDMTLDDLEEDDSVLMDIFDSELSADACKAFQKMAVNVLNHKPMNTTPVRGLLWWNSGYASPQVILFDENNKIIDDIKKNVVEFC